MTDSEISLLAGIATTRAIRRYTGDPIPEDDLARIMFSATRAPTGSNRQGFRFLVLRDGPTARAARELLGDTFRASWKAKRADDGYDEAGKDTGKARMMRAMNRYVDRFEDSPVVVLACIRERHGGLADGASIYPACQNLLLAARGLGYGGVLTGWHFAIENRLREVCGIPEGVRVAAVITLGRPEGSHGPVRRKPLRELIFEDRWGAAAPWTDEDPPVPCD